MGHGNTRERGRDGNSGFVEFLTLFLSDMKVLRYRSVTLSTVFQAQLILKV